jgi:hypothetical protein
MTENRNASAQSVNDETLEGLSDRGTVKAMIEASRTGTREGAIPAGPPLGLPAGVCRERWVGSDLWVPAAKGPPPREEHER